MINRICSRATIVATILAGLLTSSGQGAAVDLQPTTTIFLPNIVKMLGGADGWNTPFIVQNVGKAATDVTFDFYRFADGALVKSRRVAGLAPGTSAFHSPNHDAELAAGGQYSVVVKSFGSQVVAVVNEHQNEANAQQQEALSYDGLTSGSTKVFLPYVAALAQGWYCTVIAQNLGEVATTVTADFRSFDGTKTAQLVRAIPARGSKFIDPRFEPALVAGMEYAVAMTSNQAIGVVVNCHNDTPPIRNPRAFSYNGVPPTNENLTFAPYAANNVLGRSTRLIVQNAGSAPAQPSLGIFSLADTAGQSVDGPIGLQPGAVWTYDVAAGPALGEKSLVVSGGQFALVAITQSASTAMAYTGNTERATRLYLPNITRTLGGPTGWTTPILVQSEGAFVATLRWYRFADGVLVHTQRLVFGFELVGTAFKVDPRSIAALADDTQYAVVIDASVGGIGAVVLELNDRGGDSAMSYEGMAAAPTAPFGTSNCSPSFGPSGSSFRCRLYGFPPGATPVTASVSIPGGSPTTDTLSDEPVAPDGSWTLTLRAVAQGPRTLTVTAAGITRTASFTVTPPSFGIEVVRSTNGAFWIRTKPDAACVAFAELPDGSLSTAQQFSEVRIAEQGSIGWNYPAAGGSGTGTHVALCTSDGETQQVAATYTVP